MQEVSAAVYYPLLFLLMRIKFNEIAHLLAYSKTIERMALILSTFEELLNML